LGLCYRPYGLSPTLVTKTTFFSREDLKVYHVGHKHILPQGTKSIVTSFSRSNSYHRNTYYKHCVKMALSCKKALTAAENRERSWKKAATSNAKQDIPI